MSKPKAQNQKPSAQPEGPRFWMVVDIDGDTKTSVAPVERCGVLVRVQTATAAGVAEALTFVRDARIQDYTPVE